jgi:hypothetical protein
MSRPDAAPLVEPRPATARGARTAAPTTGSIWRRGTTAPMYGSGTGRPFAARTGDASGHQALDGTRRPRDPSP